MSRDSCTERNQIVSLFAGFLEFAAQRGIAFESRREALVKVDSKIPILLRLELAKYSEDTPYSITQLMRFSGQYKNTSDIFSITENEQEYRHFRAGDSKVMSVKPMAPTAETPGGSLSANSEEARVISIDKDSNTESLTTRGPKKCSLHHGQPPATLRNPGSEDDYRGETEVNISQGVSLTSNTTGMVL